MMLKIRRAEILASSSSVIVLPGVVMTTELVGTIVRKLHVYAEVFILQPGDYILKRVAIATRHADDVALNRSLDFDFSVLDELDHFPGFVLRNAFLDLRALSHCAAGGRLNVAVV